MKSFKKLITASFIAAALFFTSTVAHAQTTPADAWRLGLGIEAGIPTAIAHHGSSFTLGGSARLQYGLTNRLALTLTAGGYHFFSKTNPATGQKYGSYGELPIKFGVKAFFLPNVYFGGEIGQAWEKLEGSAWGPHRLDLSPGIGYANNNLDVSFRYERFSSNVDAFGLLGLRVAYGFKL